MRRWMNYFSLFSSASTLICCAIPALLVTLGLGATLATIVGEVPALIVISEHKQGIFIFAGLMLALNAYLQWRNRSLACPIGEAGKACKDARSYAKPIYFISLGIYALGVYFAYLGPWLNSLQ